MLRQPEHRREFVDVVHRFRGLVDVAITLIRGRDSDEPTQRRANPGVTRRKPRRAFDCGVITLVRQHEVAVGECCSAGLGEYKPFASRLRGEGFFRRRVVGSHRKWKLRAAEAHQHRNRKDRSQDAGSDFGSALWRLQFGAHHQK